MERDKLAIFFLKRVQFLSWVSNSTEYTVQVINLYLVGFFLNHVFNHVSEMFILYLCVHISLHILQFPAEGSLR